jgi:hypothetical protein
MLRARLKVKIKVETRSLRLKVKVKGKVEAELLCAFVLTMALLVSLTGGTGWAQFVDPLSMNRHCFEASPRTEGLIPSGCFVRSFG